MPWAFAIVQDKAVLKRYSERAKSILRAPGGAVGWGSTGRSPNDHPAIIGFAVSVLNTAAVKRELGIPDGGAAVAPIVVGYARSANPAVPRKAPEILAWIKP